MLFSLWHKADVPEKSQKTSTLLDVGHPNHRRGRAQLELAEALWKVVFSPSTIIY